MTPPVERLKPLFLVFVLAWSIPARAQEPVAPPEPQPDQKADAKEPPTPELTGVRALFSNLGKDIMLLPRAQNLYIAAIGGALAAAVHPVDDTFNGRLRSHDAVFNAVFAPGKYVGYEPEQVALSVGTYVVGRWRHQPKVAHLGMDLIQAQILTEIMVEPLKLAVRRMRPDGSNNRSFPSGHAALTFAEATVLERHFGWRKAWLAYAIASYVSASRLHDNVHHVSDVVFGAAIGTIAGRTVVHHKADYWTFTPVAMPGRGVALLVSCRPNP